tara:strand:- start:363 stop:578 length:216 start_codon:yes stop_codon:yes gene_type:complete
MFKIYIDPENDTDPTDHRYYRDSSQEVAHIQAEYELQRKQNSKKVQQKEPKIETKFKPLFCKDAVTILHIR